MNAPRQTNRAGACLAAAFAVRWSWRSTFPLFGRGTTTRRQAVSRTAPRMRPISAVGASTPAWRRADEASPGSRMPRRSRPEASVPGAARRCSTSARARRSWWNIPRALFTGRTGREPRYHVAIEELQDWTYTGERLVPLKGYPGVVWERPKSRRRPRDVDDREFLVRCVPSAPTRIFR